MVSVIQKLYQRIEKEETLPILFYESSITLISIPNKAITRKEDYKQSLINISAKYSNELNAVRVTKLCLFQEGRVGLIFGYQSMLFTTLTG